MTSDRREPWSAARSTCQVYEKMGGWAREHGARLAIVGRLNALQLVDELRDEWVHAQRL